MLRPYLFLLFFTSFFMTAMEQLENDGGAGDGYSKESIEQEFKVRIEHSIESVGILNTFLETTKSNNTEFFNTIFLDNPSIRNEKSSTSRLIKAFDTFCKNINRSSYAQLKALKKQEKQKDKNLKIN